MTKQGKILGFTLCWALYGVLVWALAHYAQPAKAAAILAIIGSATYFALLCALFFGGRRIL